MGADFLTVGTDSTKSTEVDSATGSALSPVMNTGTNKRREFALRHILGRHARLSLFEQFCEPLSVPTEEVFPISKKVRRERSESPPLERNKRPLSQILAKVRAKKDATLVPRNIKLKQDGKSSGVDDICSNKSVKENSTLIAKSSANKEQRAEDVDSEEYGPRVVLPSGPLPISEDEDDEMQLTHSVVVEKKQLGVIKIASLSEVINIAVRRFQKTIAAVKSTKLLIGDDGEVPVSEASGPSTSSNEKAFRFVEARNGDMWNRDRSLANRERAEKRDASDRESIAESSKLNIMAQVQPLPVAAVIVTADLQVKALDQAIRDAARANSLAHCVDQIVEGFAVTGIPLGSVADHEPGRSQGHGEATLRTLLRSYSRERRHRRDRRRRNTDEKSDDHKIDKKKLLEIAQRNAAQMAQHLKKLEQRDLHTLALDRLLNFSFNLPKGFTCVEKMKFQIGGLPNAAPEVGGGIAQIGGQSVDQLVDFCQKLQRSQEKAERREKGEEVSSDEDEIASMKKRKSEDDTDFVKHPFALKPSAPITINIANSIPLPIKTPTQRTMEETQLRICYPVSSGQQHREKDVTTGSALPEKGSSYRLPPPPPPPLLAPVTSESTSNSTNVGSNPPPISSSPTSFLGCLPPPPPPPELHLQDSTGADTAGPSGLPSARAQSDDGSVFQEPAPALLAKTPANVGRVLARRVQAKKRLTEDPNDVEAMNMLKEADDQMNAWAASKYVVGQFTGTTGVNILTAEQLAPDDPRYSAWAKKVCFYFSSHSFFTGGTLPHRIDLFKSANKVTGGVGHKLMQKMGWSPGEGLGKDRDGPLEPLTLDVKSDRKGLVSTDELPPPKKPHAVVSVDVAGKHPVSMLMEICSKRHWSPPQFTCIESGPSNNRRFMWKAVVNGVEYEPLTTSTSKKTGKAQVCEVVLQSLGFKQGDSSSW
ncbi:unnamed protein product [Toxocara canis]|uniref:CDT1 domain-containing protein n=1 Tax=Toxocara canis TaxID=6265 RepID=A0A183UVI5_TOXCA|nr:unnamed protein product [Toxocara canis]